MSPDARLLRVLREASVHLLPGDIAGLSLAEVEAGLTRLQGSGFDIESKPGLGCRLLGSPDRIIADDLHSRLVDCSIAREILVFEETSSTNDVAASLGRQGHPGGLAIFAERQTAGRGRFGRRWVSAGHEGVWFSLLLRPEMPLAEWTRLTTWAGVAVAAAAGPAARIKWPNDVLVGGKKVAGILIESSTDAIGKTFAVVGIGVNVNQTEFPGDLADRATSLRLQSGHVMDRAGLAVAVIGELERRFTQLTTEFPAILTEMKLKSSVLGQWVQLHSGAEIFEGIAEDFDSDGNVLIRLDCGELRKMNAGEISTRPPQSFQ